MGQAAHDVNLEKDPNSKKENVPPGWWNCLYNYVGLSEGKLVKGSPERVSIQLEKGDRVIVASDGLFDVLSLKQIAEISVQSDSVRQLRNELFHLVEDLVMANSSVKDDNTTVAVFEMQNEPERIAQQSTPPENLAAAAKPVRPSLFQRFRSLLGG